jgi:periplasmic divalent cation tolerance protein
VNIVPRIKSIYKWQGNVEKDTEVLCIAKTTRTKFPEFAKFVKKNHPYDVPEIIATQVDSANTDYFNWVIESVNKK